MNILHNRICYAISLVLFTSTSQAQVNGTFVDNLQTIQVKANGEWGEPPVILLGGNNYVEISFDDLQHDYVRYTYTITHCNADWTQSDLYEGDYMTGINGSDVLDDYGQSVSTEMAYNHYFFRLPNSEHRLLVSGNYKVDIFEDGDDNPVATACFCILEPKVGIDISVNANTDIDTYEHHQQVDFNINYQTYATSNPETEFMPVVLQNNRWDNRVCGIKPSYIRSRQLVYVHNRSLIFSAGNEYRRFEILNKYVPTMRVDAMQYEEPYYHAYILEDLQRINYKYDQDQDGRFLIRNTDDVDNETESDYFYTHFRLKMPQIANGCLYLNGDLTNGRFEERYRMHYNLIDHQYELTLPLKQGSYNYQYLFVRDGETVGQTASCEGDYFQTENEYHIYVYHRAFGARYDRLVGFQSVTFKGNNAF